MNIKFPKYISKRYRSLFLWTISLCIISLACSLTDSVPHLSATPNSSPITLDYPLNEIPTEEEQILDLPAISSQNFCTVSASVLHLRSCAGIDCPVDAWLMKGEVLTILQPGTTWINVQTSNGKTGWVNATYCGGK